MKILAIESTGAIGSIALLEDANLKTEVQFNHGQRITGAILRAIEFALEFTNWELSEIDYFAVDIGPGQFTALKVGVGIAKTLAQVQNKPVVGVRSLELIRDAAGADSSFPMICVVSTGKDEYYTQTFNNNHSEPKIIKQSGLPQEIEAIRAEKIIIAGLMNSEQSQQLSENQSKTVLVLPNIQLSACQVGKSAIREIELGNISTAFDLAPNYVKLPSISIPKRKYGLPPAK